MDPPLPVGVNSVLSTEFTAWLWGHSEPLLYQQSFLLRTRILRAMIHVNSKITLAGRQKTAHIIVNFVINIEQYVQRFSREWLSPAVAMKGF